MGRRSTQRGGVRICAAIAALAALVACSPQTQAESPNDQSITITETKAPDVHPVSGLAVIPLTVQTDDEKIGFRVEVADTPQAQARGLMFRTELGANEGMIFPYNPPGVQSFWMKNTPSSLDIIYVGPDERIINIHENTEPLSEESLPSAGPASLVLEIRGGRSAELGIEPGDRVTW